MTTTPERWLAGPVEDVPALLQPVAHALIQAEREIIGMMSDFAAERNAAEILIAGDGPVTGGIPGAGGTPAGGDIPVAGDMANPNTKLFQRPFGMASIGFHLKHIAGVLDRLCTYARKEQLSTEQLAYLKQEEEPTGTAEELLAGLSRQVALTIEQLKSTNVEELTEFRGVGRKQVPSTLIGLLSHAAEHTMRHTGQLLVTVKAVRAMNI